MPLQIVVNMSKALSEDILFTLCFIQLQEIKDRLYNRNPFNPSKEETIARLKIVDSLFELAAGAAIKREMKRGSTRALVELVENIRDRLEWNTRN